MSDVYYSMLIPPPKPLFSLPKQLVFLPSMPLILNIPPSLFCENDQQIPLNVDSFCSVWFCAIEPCMNYLNAIALILNIVCVCGARARMTCDVWFYVCPWSQSLTFGSDFRMSTMSYRYILFSFSIQYGRSIQTIESNDRSVWRRK